MEGDFKIFYLASKDLNNSLNLYEQTYVNGFHYFYSPLFAVLLFPLTLLSSLAAAWIWNFFNFILLYRTWYILMQFFDPKTLQNKGRKRWLALSVFFFGIYGIYANLHNHQMTILLVWAIFESLRFSNQNKAILGGGLLALVINFKIMPIVLIFYLLYRRNYKLVGYTFIFSMVYLGLPIIFIGYDYNSLLLQGWWELINPLNKEHIIDISERGLSSLTTLIPILLMDIQYWNDIYSFPRNILSLEQDTVIKILNATRLLFTVFICYFLRSLPFVKAKNKLHQFWELSYLLICTMLVFPHQQHYAFFLGFPAIFYISYYLIISWNNGSGFYSWSLLLFMIIVTLAINSPFLLGEWRNWISYVKIPTYGFILLIIPLSIITPKKVEKAINTL